MNRRDIEGVIKDIAPAIKEYIEAALAPMVVRVAQLESRRIEHGNDGAGISDAVIDREGVLILTLTDGRSLRPGVVAGKDGDPGQPGKDPEPEAIAQMVRKEIETRLPDAVAAIALQKGDPGEPGRDADPEFIVKVVRDEVAIQLPEAVAAIPVQKGDPGKDGAPGKDADMAKIEALVDKAVQSIERVKGDPGNDGTGISDAVIERGGDLVLTLSDGRVKQLGRVAGRDGLGFDDLEEVLSDDGRLIIRRYKRGAETKEFHHRVPVIIDRGVYSEEREYATGDAVTWGGSLWIAQAPTAQKPGQSDTWRLAVKRGRDGKDAQIPEAKPKAKSGSAQ
jgi:integrin beta 3